MMKFVVHIFLVFFVTLSCTLANAQTFNNELDGYIVGARVAEGDTIPSAMLRTSFCVAPREFKNERQRRKYNKFKNKVIKVYPYAQLAAQKLQAYDAVMQEMNEKQRKKYMKQIEQELNDEFSGELRKLSMSQGQVLVKLIDRQTGNTSYELVKELRGVFSAFVWQSFARLFGQNLKTNYDPKGEDKLIEEVCVLIEAGVYPVKSRNSIAAK